MFSGSACGVVIRLVWSGWHLDGFDMLVEFDLVEVLRVGEVVGGWRG